MKRLLLIFFIDLYKLDDKNYWGYIANCSSESILYCIWKARDYLKRYHKPIKIICNKFTHYAIDKAAEILNLELVKISSDAYGELDYQTIESDLDTECSYIFCATIGSTMTSSIDNITKIKSILNKKNIHHHIHADAAFDGSFLPFTNDFDNVRGFDSLNISGHKFIGSPMPSGITIIKKQFVASKYIEYVSNNDMTIGGSRNALTPYLLYKRIQQIGGKNGLKNRFLECLDRAKKYQKILTVNNINVFRHTNSITLVLRDIPLEIMKKWHAPTQGNLTTLTALPKFTEEKLYAFIDDVKASNNNDFILNMKTVMPIEVNKL